jgi:formate hydrogenlyase subunit 4
MKVTTKDFLKTLTHAQLISMWVKQQFALTGMSDKVKAEMQRRNLPTTNIQL